MSTPDRIFNAEARAIDLMVWIDGVEVPFSDVEISYQMDSPSRCAISIEPDEVIELWRPKSWIHIWVRDPFPDPARVPFENASNPEIDQRDIDYDKNTYMLLWEGEVVSINDTETSESRQTVITGHDLWNIPANTNINLVDIGGGLKVAFVNGSSFFADAIDPSGDSTRNLIMLGMVNYLFKNQNQPFREGGEPKAVTGITEIGRQLLLYLSQYNASYGLQSWRTNFFEKFTGIPDKTIQSFLRFALLDTMIGRVQQNQVSPDVLGYFVSVISKFFYHFVTVPLPPIKNQLANGRPSNIDSWSELGIIPNLYYAFAPLCNWLFPEHYTQRQVGRDFMAEPTRLGLSSQTTTLAGFRTVHLAPENLLERVRVENNAPISERGDDPTSMTRMHGGRGTQIPVDSQSDLEFESRGFYLSPTDDQPVNLLRFMTPDELEKGILYTESQNAYQEMLGVGRLNAGAETPEEAKDKLRQSIQDKDAYADFMRLLAQYELNFRQVSRFTQISGVFNPWPVVGLPMMICREGRSYKGLLVAMTHRISYGGGSSTGYELAYTQLFRPRLLSQQQGFKNAKQKLEKASEIRQEEYVELLESLRDRGLITQEELDQLNQSSIGDIEAKLNELRDEAEEATESLEELERFFDTRRRGVSIYPVSSEDAAGNRTELPEGSYGNSWFAQLDRAAGLVNALINENVQIRTTTVLGGSTQPSPDLYQFALQDGAALASSNPDASSVMTDQLSQGEISSFTYLKGEVGPEVSGGELAAFWSELIRGLSLIYHEVKALVDAAIKAGGQGRSDLFATDAAVEAQRAASLAALDREIKQLNRSYQLKKEAGENLLASLQRQLSEAQTKQANLTSLIAQGGTGTERNQRELAIVTQRISELQATIDFTNQSLAENEEVLDEIEDLENAKEDAPEVSPWRWQKAMDQTFAFFGNAADLVTVVSSAGDVLFDIDFEKGSIDGFRSASWRTLFDLERVGGGDDGLVRLKRLVDRFLEQYERYFGTRDLDYGRIRDNIVRGYRDLIDDFRFDSRLSRFLGEANAGDILERVKKNYKTFKQFIAEQSMELPPLMPFHNDDVTNLDKVGVQVAGEEILLTKFDVAVRSMVVPREEEGNLAYWVDSQTPFATSFTESNQIYKTLQQEVAFRYDEYVRMARKIFPFDEEDNDAEYRRQVDKGSQASWANKLQARKGVTMRQFLERTGLKLEARSASDPETFGKGTYYIAIAEGDPESVDLNSYFSKLGRLKEGTTNIDPSPQTDPLFASIAEMRAVVRQNQESGPDWTYIRASKRQEVIEEYTRRHAAARAFRGRR